MKFQLDTNNKQITISESVNFGELVDTLKKLFPHGEWKAFELVYENTTIVLPTAPIFIPYDAPSNPYQPTPWWEQPWITCKADSPDYKLNPGIFEITTTAGGYDNIP